MKYESKKQIKELEIEKYVKVVDKMNDDIIGRYDNLKSATKDVNDYIEDCDGDCDLWAYKYHINKENKAMELIEIYHRRFSSKWILFWKD